ncbi:MAG: hypothetical protein L0G94_01115 [Brachybacterium sp.]|uniref:hypothetical protein n=1 Tax=Brachybacterium sp. TaxID=1891286 RepID=UPI00264A1650|nr:hypothetical protein [Brachybacterium sp.]MDN5685270.1 hypothetical protein [Brachybacterium sp.]
MSASNAVAADTPRTGPSGSGSAADATERSGPGTRDATGGKGGKKKLTGREKRNLRVGLLFISPGSSGSRSS